MRGRQKRFGEVVDGKGKYGQVWWHSSVLARWWWAIRII